MDEGAMRMGQSLLVAACRSSESFSILGNPRPESCGCLGVWWKQSLGFLALMSAFALVPDTML